MNGLQTQIDFGPDNAGYLLTLDDLTAKDGISGLKIREELGKIESGNIVVRSEVRRKVNNILRSLGLTMSDIIPVNGEFNGNTLYEYLG